MSSVILTGWLMTGWAIDLFVIFTILCVSRKEKEGKKGKRSKKRRGGDDSDEEEIITPKHTVSSVFDMPEGASIGDSDGDDDGKDDVIKKLDINLDE